MKKMIGLSAICLSATVLLIQANSFSTASVKSETNLSIVREEGALVAITYLSKDQMLITNNKEKEIVIESIELLDDKESEVIHVEKVRIRPGDSIIFDLTEGEAGQQLRIKTYWNGGSADLYSTIKSLNK